MKFTGLRRKETTGAWAAPAVLLVTYVVALALLVVSALVDYRIARELQESGRTVSRTIEAMEKLRQIGNTFYIAEASQRGYVLTGKDAYLEPYREMHGLIDTRLDETKRLVSDTASQGARVTTLRSLAERRFAQMDRTLEAYRSDGLPGALDVVNRDEGLQTMMQARATIQAMLAEETTLLAERRAAGAEAAAGGRVQSLLASVVVALALSVFYLLTRRYLRQRDLALDEVKSSNAELERRVAERTIELSNLSRHLLHIREDEKKSIARELHDEFGSFLTAINMDVSRMRDKISATNPEQAARFDRTLGLLNQAIAMKRRLISDLRPSILDNLGLGAALEQYIDEWSRYTGISATFDYSGDIDSEEDGCLIAIFRVFQEALTNVVKHSGATEVHTHVRRVGAAIEFEIADNGSGLSDSARVKPDAHGLLGIRERVLAYQGRLEFSQSLEGGTVIRASLPCKAVRDDRALAVETAAHA